MSTLRLRLEGPLQSWSSQGKLLVRDTEREPTKSGVLGLVGAALGMDRDDDATLATLVQLRMAARVDRPGSLLRDYQTAGGGRFRGDRGYTVHGTSDCVPTTRYYLQDASFVVGLEGDRALLARIAEAFGAPRYPLYLGRRSCPLGAHPLLDLVDRPLRDAMRDAPVAERATDDRLRLVIEVADALEGDARYDVPLSFRPFERRYGVRYVQTDWIARERAATRGEATA